MLDSTAVLRGGRGWPGSGRLPTGRWEKFISADVDPPGRWYKFISAAANLFD